MIESKSLTVPPSLENSTIDLWQNFGWTLKSTQEINTEQYVLQEKDDGLYNVPVVIFLIFMFKKRNQAKKMYIEEYNAWSEKMNTEGKQILDEATSLLA